MSAALSVQELRSTPELEELRDEWSSLFDRSRDATPFHAPEWLLPWWRYFAGQGLWALAVRAGRTLVGFAPLFIYTEPRSQERRACFMGNGMSDHLGVLHLADHRDGVAAALFDHLARRSELWDVCDFRDLCAHSAILRARCAPSLSERIEADEPCVVLPLPKDPDAVLGAAPPRFRENLRRSARQAVTRYSMTAEAANESTLEAALAALFSLHAARWHQRGEPGVLDSDAHWCFHREAAAALHRRGLAELYVLRAGEKIVAAHYVLRHRGSAASYITGFDPAYARVSPGALLTLHVLEQSARGGDREFDFLRGREPYKYRWGATDRAQFRRRLWKRAH